MNPPEVERVIERFGKASIFSFAVYDELSNEDLFVLTKGVYVACKVNGVDLPEDFEKYMTIVEVEEDKERAMMFNRNPNTNLNIVLGGSLTESVDFLTGLLLEGLEYMKVKSEFIGFYEVESNV
jgi:hypothetical protein